MLRWCRNVGYLSVKELKSLFSDLVLIILICYMFSAALVMMAKNGAMDVKNASVGVVNYDRSALSYQLTDALIMPSFKKVEEIDPSQADRLMDTGQYTFIVDIPTGYQRDILAGRNPKIQLLVDATAMSQAGIGSSYITQIFNREVHHFLGTQTQQLEPIQAVIHVLHNPNYSSEWFMGTVQIVSSLTLLTLLLVGSAVIRERERGTIEHLLVMPVYASEIAIAKIVANGLVLLIVSSVSLYLIVSRFLGLPLTLSSIAIFALGVAIFLFSIASLGILLAIFAPTMPQFGLLATPVFLVMYMLSGTLSPLENMPQLAQQITQFSPLTILGSYTQDVLFRGARLDIVWPHLIKMVGIGILFLSLALIQFKSMLSRQG
ncbi:ABC transporter permease [Pasteurellaceae bacterium 15-036681]|nr:ABC transporter permease [Pasteurellaceae bacterium 15-036681]